jgi:hypothetical protein
MKRVAPKGSELERWLAVGLRSVHLCGVVWVGAAVVGGTAVSPAAAATMIGGGAVMFAMDLRAGRIALAELAGAFVLLKLLLVAWMVLDAARAPWIFWGLVAASSVTSHAPKAFRHWPTRPRAAAQTAASSRSKPG